MLVFIFLIPALSRRFWPGGAELRATERLIEDPELRMALGLVLGVGVMLFLRHFLGAIEVDRAAPRSDRHGRGRARPVGHVGQHVQRAELSDHDRLDLCRLGGGRGPGQGWTRRG